MSSTAAAASSENDESLDVIVVGAGFSGLYALHKLRDELGLRVRVFEAGEGVGGTWYWNRYPGARCDSESHYYCYSFSKELLDDWSWSSRYPEQPEILSYLDHVADRFDLRRDIQLASRVSSASFDEENERWVIEIAGGERVSAPFLVSAVGCLSSATLPEIAGLDRFAGESYHTSRWPHEGVDFSGKRVGLVGTGSTGIQAAPVIAEEAAHLTVFQRTPNYSVPTRNGPITPERYQQIREDYDEIWELALAGYSGYPFRSNERSAFDVDDAEREKILEALWSEGGFQFLWGSFNDILIDRAANETVASFIRQKIRETVKDPETADRLCPTDHPYGTKRPPIDTFYFETFNRDDVDLVDLREAPIEEITATGIRTAQGEVPLDVIVFATGFDAMTGSLLRMDIRGRGGLPLAEKWEAGPTTYIGLGVAGFPNLFTITGPGSPSVLCNMPLCIEQHVEWIADCLRYLRKEGVRTIEARPEAEAAWVKHANNVARHTLYYDAASWYVGANVPGKPRIFMPYAGGLPNYRARCDEVAAKGYEGFELSR